MSRVLIAYATQTGNTREIAQIIAEGCRFAGGQATVKTLQDIADPAELQEFDAIVLGSATYNSRMMDEMEQFLEVMKTVNLEGKRGGAFGAYGWSGEAPDQIFKVMKDDLKMKLVSDSLRLKQVSLPGGMKMAQDYGRAVIALAQE
jgi:flavorubredoxin